MDNAMRKLIQAQKGKIRFSRGRSYELSLPASGMMALLKHLPSTVYARMPYPMEAVSVTSQGVALTGAGDDHTLGDLGAGIKIGIIDLGFAGYTNSQASGDLPTSLIITDYTGSGTGGINHGTQVAEIVHDMAPSAQLYLAKIATTLQLQQAVNDMASQGVKIINHSVAWYGAAYYDGTGSLCDITNTAQADGILWLNAAGNSRTKHYMSIFTDADSDLRHEFSSGQNYNSMYLSQGGSVTLVLNWDAYPVTNIDYNLYLYNGNPDAGGTLVASSEDRQSGNQSSYPYEVISYTAATAGTYYIVVKKTRNSVANVPLTLFSLGPDFAIKTYASSLPEPADCSSVMSVAATNLVDGVEGFSSEGPTTDGRMKPEIAAPNRVTTSLSASFAGTSAASPHATGAAALLLARNPGYSVAQLRTGLINTSLDLLTTGFDYRTGYGRISMDSDNDDFNHDTDNCPLVANPDQSNIDNDNLGDICDDDIDGDGLLNTQETALGTDPYMADTDGDGLSDGNEVNSIGTNPLLMDTDGDGLSDGTEVNAYGTNPLTSNLGDIAPSGNPDGVVNVADLMMLYRFIDNLATPDAKDTTLADMNHDGQIDVRDALILTKQISL